MGASPDERQLIGTGRGWIWFAIIAYTLATVIAATVVVTLVVESWWPW